MTDPIDPLHKLFALLERAFASGLGVAALGGALCLLTAWLWTSIHQRTAKDAQAKAGRAEKEATDARKHMRRKDDERIADLEKRLDKAEVQIASLLTDNQFWRERAMKAEAELEVQRRVTIAMEAAKNSLRATLVTADAVSRGNRKDSSKGFK